MYQKHEISQKGILYTNDIFSWKIVRSLSFVHTWKKMERILGVIDASGVRVYACHVYTAPRVDYSAAKRDICIP